jgi:hypothetical protein
MTRGQGSVLAALAAAAAVLAALLIGGEGERERPPARLFPDFEAASVAAIEIERAGEGSIRLERSGGGEFAIAAPRATPADPGPVVELLGALEMIAPQRRGGDARGLEAPRTRVRAIAAGGERLWELSIGERVGASNQLWVGRGDEAFLVEGHYERALAPDLAALRERRPFRQVAAASALFAEIDGASWRLELGAPLQLVWARGAAWADGAAASSLLRALRELEIELDEDLASRDDPDAPALTLRAQGARGASAELRVIGACADGELAVATQLGRGCAAREALEAIADRARDPLALVDPRVLGDTRGPFARVALSAGDGALTLRHEEGRYVTAAGEEVELAQVRRFLRDLAAQIGEPRELPRGSVELARLELEPEGGPSRALVFSRDRTGLYVARAGEPLAFALADEAQALVRPDPLVFRARALIAREPHAATELRRSRPGRDAEVLRRGELAGEYALVSPAGGVVRTEAVRQAIAVAARLRAEGYASATPAAGHGLARPRAVLELAFEPAPLAGADPETHLIAIGRAAPGGCYARVDDGPVAIVASDACEALLAPWRD